MNFGKIDHFMLLGGGPLLSELAKKLADQGVDVVVVTSERHSTELLADTGDLTLVDFLTRQSIEFIISENVNKDSAVIRKITGQTLGMSLGAAWIFRPNFIDLFGGRLVNVHGTRLPQDRGGGGFSWRIMRDDRLGFSVIHQIDPGVDTGSIIEFDEFFYPHSCRLPIEYRNYSAEKSHALLDQFIGNIKTGREFETISQPEYLSTYWPRLSSDAHGYIDWSWKLKDIEQFICAFDDPYPGAITFVNDLKVRLKKCLSTSGDGTFHPFQTGIIYKMTGGALFVAAQEGSLIVRSVSDDSRTDLTATLTVGDRFHTPFRCLEDARRFRAIYTPRGLGSAVSTRDLRMSRATDAMHLTLGPGDREGAQP